MSSDRPSSPSPLSRALCPPDVIPVPGLDPGIIPGTHVFCSVAAPEDVGGRTKSGHDGRGDDRSGCSISLRQGDRGWRDGQPGAMSVMESVSRIARHARLFQADQLGFDPQGRPPANTGLRGLRRDRSPPHSCDASRARPSSGGDGQGYSRGWEWCQEQSENITSRLAQHPPSRVMAGLVPVIPTRGAPRLTASGWPGQARP